LRLALGHGADRQDTATVFTIDAFAPYNALASDCMGPFLIWWRQNFPGPNNEAVDDDGNPMLNWWPFLFY
jgi:uncharacterized Tic20 family protein